MDNSNSFYAAVPVSPLRIAGGFYHFRHYIKGKKVQFMLKRSFDIAFSLAVILCILSWMIPLVWILTSLDSKGPLFFVQKRVGLGGKTFLCLKFRTMIINPERDNRPAEEADERITTLGAWLRKLNIDELPQFINVLIGDMSVVGPRPHMHVDCVRFSSVIPDYKFRNIVKPGLTGLAQIKGFRGPAFTQESIRQRYLCDNHYIKHLSILLDSKIIAITIFQRVKACLTIFQSTPHSRIGEWAD